MNIEDTLWSWDHGPLASKKEVKQQCQVLLSAQEILQGNANSVGSEDVREDSLAGPSKEETCYQANDVLYG